MPWVCKASRACDIHGEQLSVVQSERLKLGSDVCRRCIVSDRGGGLCRSGGGFLELQHKRAACRICIDCLRFVDVIAEGNLLHFVASSSPLRHGGYRCPTRERHNVDRIVPTVGVERCASARGVFDDETIRLVAERNGDIFKVPILNLIPDGGQAHDRGRR